MKDLTKPEYLRYSRHFNLAQVGIKGQRRLKNSSVLLIGAGGLGSPLALYLAAAGVGRIGLVDFDVVDETNLQRQVLHGTEAVGRPKLESAEQRLKDLNPHVTYELHQTRLSADNALEIFKNYDVVADGADNFPTRYLVNDAAFLTGIPLVSGSILGFEGQLSVFNYKGGPCYRCLFPAAPPPGSVPSCAEGGVLGILPGVIGSLQATEVLKVLLDQGQVAAGRLVLYDAMALSFSSLNISRDPQCELCGDEPKIKELIDYEFFCGLGDQQDLEVTEISARDLKARMDELVVVDVRKDFEREICCIEDSRHHELDSLKDADWSLAKDTPLVTYCKTGIRSKQAAGILQEKGYTRGYSLAGGIMAWIDAFELDWNRY